MFADLERFYEILGKLTGGPNQGLRLADCTGRARWADRGVYFFREPSEARTEDPSVARIVRVGTHAVSSGSKSSLWIRLRAHKGRRSGGGNHRGSIFRSHVGAAMLGRAGVQLGTWGLKSSTSDERCNELDLEQSVSTYIGNMTVLWVEVPDAPSSASQRAVIERNAIALLSNGLNPIDEPSPSWLGRKSPSALIRQSGLWNVNHVEGEHEDSFLDLLETAVHRTLRP